MNYQPFTYLIGWSKLDRWYIGSRYAKKACPDDLWSTYFTSSQYVTAFRYVHGEPDVLLTFPAPTKTDALIREAVVIFYLGAVSSPRFLNKTMGGRRFYTDCRINPQSDETKAKRGASISRFYADSRNAKVRAERSKQLWADADFRAKMHAAQNSPTRQKTRKADRTQSDRPSPQSITYELADAIAQHTGKPLETAALFGVSVWTVRKIRKGIHTSQRA